MQTKIKSIQRLHDVETGEVLNKVSIYITDKINTIKSRKSGFIEAETNSFSLYDSYVYSLTFDAVSGLKEGRVYKELLSDSVDTDKVLELLLANADIDVSVSKEDSENSENSLGFYFRYDVADIKLNIDEFTKASLFEIYLATYKDKTKAYLAFVAKMLGVYDIFVSELSQMLLFVPKCPLLDILALLLILLLIQINKELAVMITKLLFVMIMLLFIITFLIQINRVFAVMIKT